MSKRKIIPYKKHLIEKAKLLRKNATYSEKLLWRYLRGKQILGFRFDRQKPIDKYIVDFYCDELNLVIEIDGITHNNKKEEDIRRQNELENLGLIILRFNAFEVINNLKGVLELIHDWIKKYNQPSPTPSKEGN